MSATDLHKILTWLRDHPGSTVRSIGKATGYSGQYIRARLEAAEMGGQVRRDREFGCDPWRWSVLAQKGARP